MRRSARFYFETRNTIFFPPPRVEIDSISARSGVVSTGVASTSRFPRWSTRRKILSSGRASQTPSPRCDDTNTPSYRLAASLTTLPACHLDSRKNVPVAINNREDLIVSGNSRLLLLLLWSKSKRIMITFLPSQNPGAEKWRPMAISNPSTRLRMARSMPHWVLVRRSFSLFFFDFEFHPDDSKI